MTTHTFGPFETSVMADGTDWTVCEPDGGDMVASIVDGPDAQAIATLFAASPVVLAALVELVACIYGDDEDERSAADVLQDLQGLAERVAEPAIAQAKGN